MVGVCVCVCVCSQASRSRATLSCDSSYYKKLQHLNQSKVEDLWRHYQLKHNIIVSF